MRAVQYAQFGGPEVLQITDAPEPHAGPSEVRVAVRAVGVNPIDLEAAQRRDGRRAPARDGGRGRRRRRRGR